MADQQPTARPRTCAAPGCENPMTVDGLCEHHLWEVEHHTRYMGGPHDGTADGCPVCAGRPTGDPRLRDWYTRTRGRLLDVSRLDDGWCEGSGDAVRDEVVEEASRLLDALERAAAAADTGGWVELGPPGLGPDEDGTIELCWHSAGQGLVSATLGDPELTTILTLINHPATDHGPRPDLVHDEWSGQVDELVAALGRFVAAIG